MSEDLDVGLALSFEENPSEPDYYDNLRVFECLIASHLEIKNCYVVIDNCKVVCVTKDYFEFRRIGDECSVHCLMRWIGPDEEEEYCLDLVSDVGEELVVKDLRLDARDSNEIKIKYHEKENTIISEDEYIQQKFIAGSDLLFVTLFLQTELMKANSTGVPVTFFVDTGAPATRLHPDVIKTLRLQLTEDAYFSFQKTNDQGVRELMPVKDQVVQMTIRHKHFEGMNILGMSTLKKSGFRFTHNPEYFEKELIEFDYQRVSEFKGQSALRYEIKQ
ncbi:nuoC [Acrasis kona]|uniref:NuoC n=1 Tax=Acrasis kona TaxID=1008807 RepID=A0AAW2ZPY1_9EUKA